MFWPAASAGEKCRANYSKLAVGHSHNMSSGKGTGIFADKAFCQHTNTTWLEYSDGSVKSHTETRYGWIEQCGIG